MSDNDAIVKKLQAQAKKIDASIRMWEAKVQDADADVRRAYDDQIDDLRRLRDETENRMKAFEREARKGERRLNETLETAHDEIDKHVKKLERLFD